MRRLLPFLFFALCTACQPRLTTDQTALRAELAQALRENSYTQADATLTKLLALTDNAADRASRALTRRKLRRWGEALDDLQHAQELQPDAPEVRTAAEVFAHADQFLTRIRELDARLALTPGDDQLLTDRALLLLRSGDGELALDDSKAAAKIAAWAIRPRLFAGLALVALGRPLECEALGVSRTLKLIAFTPEFLETISRLDAEISVERANPELYVSRAWELSEIGQPGLALQDAESALRCDARSAVAHVESAYALSKLNRPDDAFDRIKRATELDPNFTMAWQYRGDLEMTRGDFESAIKSLSRALTLEDTPVTREKRANCYEKAGLPEKAEEDRRALEAPR